MTVVTVIIIYFLSATGERNLQVKKITEFIIMIWVTVSQMLFSFCILMGSSITMWNKGFYDCGFQRISWEE